MLTYPSRMNLARVRFPGEVWSGSSECGKRQRRSSSALVLFQQMVHLLLSAPLVTRSLQSSQAEAAPFIREL